MAFEYADRPVRPRQILVDGENRFVREIVNDDDVAVTGGHGR